MIFFRIQTLRCFSKLPKTQHTKIRSFSKNALIQPLLSSRGNFPEHIVLRKDRYLLDNLTVMNKAPAEAKNEFSALQEFGLKQINETTDIGQQNSPHNRKENMLPYDNNRIELSTAVGDPPSTYINASPITFPGLKQQFIALSAPEPGSFSSFWQMVLDQEVSIIVMLTDLKENDKVKADQYWPDCSNAVMELDSGIKVKYVSHTEAAICQHTQLTVENSQGETREIDHLHTRSFRDGGVPRDTRVILDLLFQCQEILRIRPGPVAVHCSGGAGRTGTFIAVFKLATEYDMEEVEELDVFDTVITMWRQRMKMVNKPEHYHYIFKCLSHYVTVNLYAE